MVTSIRNAEAYSDPVAARAEKAVRGLRNGGVSFRVVGAIAIIGGIFCVIGAGLPEGGVSLALFGFGGILWGAMIMGIGALLDGVAVLIEQGRSRT